MVLVARDWWLSPPPPPRSRAENWPTLLFSWWATCFSASIIVIRLCGRKVRSNQLFREDWIMMIALVPLFIRMFFIHYVLIYGTNNIDTAGWNYTSTQLEHHSMGARLVLAARIFFAGYIWLCKLTVSEFLKRITIRIWRRSYEITLQAIRIFLLLTFLAVVIATLAECHPFSHYWQVIPDPGPQCRLGYGNLLTMSACDIISDILLIVFPIPVVLRSGQTWKRKLQMTALFSLSAIMIGVTATRVPLVIGRHGLQQYRTVWASSEILAATFVSNGVILGSFLRDKGTKRNRYRSYSMSDSIERAPPAHRRPTLRSLHHPDDSDEELFRDLAGCRMPEHLQEEFELVARPAPPAVSVPGHTPSLPSGKQAFQDIKSAKQVESGTSSSADGGASSSNNSTHHWHHHHHNDDLMIQPLATPVSSSTNRSVNFFDVGNLLDDHTHVQHFHRNYQPSASATTSSNAAANRLSAYDPLSIAPDDTTTMTTAAASALRSHDTHLSPTSSPSPRGGSSRTFLQDMGGILSMPRFHHHHHHHNQPHNNHHRSSSPHHASGSGSATPTRTPAPPPTGILGPQLERHLTQASLQDAGGLLKQ